MLPTLPWAPECWTEVGAECATALECGSPRQFSPQPWRLTSEVMMIQSPWLRGTSRDNLSNDVHQLKSWQRKWHMRIFWCRDAQSYFRRKQFWRCLICPWAHGTTGIAAVIMPSRTMQSSTKKGIWLPFWHRILPVWPTTEAEKHSHSLYQKLCLNTPLFAAGQLAHS